MLFVCVHNSARSQYAAALWRQRTGNPHLSVGTQPVATVHPRAVEAAADLGVDLSSAVPRGYRQTDRSPDLVVSICDRVRESDAGVDAPRLRWSVPDPVSRNDISAFRSPFGEIAVRMERLIRATSTAIDPSTTR